MIELKAERTAVSNSIKGLLAGSGPGVIVDETLPTQLENLRQWDGAKLPPRLHQRLLREFQRWQLINRQIDELEAERIGEDSRRQDAAGREGAAALESQGDRRERSLVAGV